MVRHEPWLRSPEPPSQRDAFEADIVVIDLYHAGIDQDLEAANPVIVAVGDCIATQRSHYP